MSLCLTLSLCASLCLSASFFVLLCLSVSLWQEQDISASEFIQECDANQDGDISASELHRAYRDVVVPDPDDPQDTELSIGEARQVSRTQALSLFQLISSY